MTHHSALFAFDLITRWMPSGPGEFTKLFAESTICLGCAALCGFFVGCERQRLDKPAGMRTHILVCLGSAAFVHLGARAQVLGDFGTVTDFNRLIQSIATGIGFLGAGAIFRSRDSVTGVTTAASLWVMGAVGAAAGVGAVLFAFLLTAVTYVVLRFLRMFEHKAGN